LLKAEARFAVQIKGNKIQTETLRKPSLRKPYRNLLIVYGGSFDPPHLIHYLCVLGALDYFIGARVLIVPAFRSSHKAPAVMKVWERVRLLKQAFQGLSSVFLSDMEIKTKKPVPTWKTLERVKKKYSFYEIRFLLGADSYQNLSRWGKPERLRKLAHFIVYPRPSYKVSLKKGDTLLCLPALQVESKTIRDSQILNAPFLIPLLNFSSRNKRNNF